MHHSDQPPPSGALVEVVFVTGPPFAPVVWDAVRERLGRPSRALAAADHPDGWPPPAEGIQPPRFLVAHGLAIPSAARWARQPGVLGLIVSNGPITRLDPISASLSALARRAPAVAEGLLRPSIWTRWLASSFGLRRAVNNPYVMERDFVVAVAGAAVGTTEARRATVRVLADLAPAGESLLGLPLPVATIWGGGDPLYPTFEADYLHAGLPSGARRDVPGGRWAHLVEQPWAYADALASILALWEEGRNRDIAAAVAGGRRLG